MDIAEVPQYLRGWAILLVFLQGLGLVFFLIFIYLAAPGCGFGVWDFQSLLGMQDLLVVACGI